MQPGHGSSTSLARGRPEPNAPLIKYIRASFRLKLHNGLFFFLFVCSLVGFLHHSNVDDSGKTETSAATKEPESCDSFTVKLVKIKRVLFNTDVVTAAHL